MSLPIAVKMPPPLRRSDSHITCGTHTRPLSREKEERTLDELTTMRRGSTLFCSPFSRLAKKDDDVLDNLSFFAHFFFGRRVLF